VQQVPLGGKKRKKKRTIVRIPSGCRYSKVGDECPGTAAELPSHPDTEQLFPRNPNQARSAGRKANNYSQFWRLQVWALGQVIANNNSFCRPRQVRTRTKKTPSREARGLSFQSVLNDSLHGHPSCTHPNNGGAKPF
jgi:hypothetical protein